MKKNNILNCLAYFLISVIIAMLILSVFYISQHETMNINGNGNIDIDYFTDIYMNKLISESKELIYNNDKYHKIQDNDNTIIYNFDENNTDNIKIENLYFLIIYKNLAYTNVELTMDTNTIEKIIKFIESQNSKKTYIYQGNVTSDTNNISRKAIKYFDDFQFKYYQEIDNSIDSTEKLSLKTNENENITSLNSEEENNKKWYLTNINDFKIYTSYKENLLGNTYNSKIESFINYLEKYDNLLYIMIPIYVMLIISLIIYLIISIGKEKNINSFDKIPIEIIIALSSIIILSLMSIVIKIDRYENYKLSISMLITTYIIFCFLGSLMFTTIIKRIKTKNFFKTTIIGKMYEKLYINIRQLTSRKIRCVIYISIILLLEVLILLIFRNALGFIIDLIILLFVISKIIKYIVSYEKIENKLKEIYMGNNKTILNEDDVELDFKDSVKYINNISKGFENAIQEKVKSERMKTELITNVSHDIKTPLTSIINYVDLLKGENIINNKAKEYIEVLDKKSQRLKTLIEDLVEASKASTGSIKLKIENINLVELLKQSIGEFEDKFNEKNLKIVLNYSEKNLIVKADNFYMYRVIENIFSNISKYALDKSRVYIDIKNVDNKIILEIKNISKDKLNISEEELIQRFVRGDKSRSTEGSGLGLSIAKDLIELQKGEFNIKIDGDLFKVIIKFNKN